MTGRSKDDRGSADPGSESTAGAVAARLLGAAGIQRRPYLALLRALVINDLRGQHYTQATGTPAKAVISPLYWVLGQYLTVSALLTAILFTRVDTRSFVCASLTNAFLMLFAAVVVEFHEAVFDPADAEIVGHHPLHPRTYATARMTNLLLYVALMTVSLTIFPAIVGAAQEDAGPWFLPAYLAASFGLGLATAAVAVLLFSLASSSEALDGVKTGLAWLQIILILVLFYGGQAMLRKGSGAVAHFAAFPPEWISRLPTWWLAEWVAGLSRGPESRHLVQLAGGAVAAAALAVLAVQRLSRTYASVHAGAHPWRRTVMARPPRPGTLAGPISGRLPGSRAAAAGFWLVGAMMARDGDLKLRNWPALSLPAGAALLVLLTGQAVDPMVSPGVAALPTLAVIALLAAALPVILHNLVFSRDHEAAWVLLAAPVGDHRELAAGARRAVMLRLMAPVMLVYLVVLAVAWRSPAHAIAHIVVGWLVLEWAARIAQSAVRQPLLSRRPAAGVSLGPVVVLGTVVGSVAMALLAVQCFASRGPGTLGLYGVALLASLVLTRGGGERRPARQDVEAARA